MKTLKHILGFVLIIVCSEAKAQDNDLYSFLEKFKIFTTINYPRLTTSMPIKKPENNSLLMPNAINPRESFMIDPETDLRIFPHQGIIYDPKTRYIISYNPEIKYYIDLKKGKVYQDKSEVKIKKLEAD